MITMLAVAACSNTADRKLQRQREMRMTPAELRASGGDTTQIGSSKLAGVQTKVLFGEPATQGFYSILLIVPANTTIQAHSHRDDRVGTVLSGNWRFGYGDRFNAAVLKQLPPGSIYTEPAGQNHFAQTTDQPVVVQITGMGPTDTRYVNPADEPKR
jgi:uncharacterized RmlC-like cupin family protein